MRPRPENREMLRITLKKSPIGYDRRQKATVRALALGRLGSATVKPDNCQVRGMIKRISHLVAVEQVDKSMPGGSEIETE